MTILSHSAYQEEPAGYIKPDGELEIKLDQKKIGQMRRFSEGFAPVGLEMAEKDDLSKLLGEESVKEVYDWTFIDRKGEFKIKLQDTFQNARPFAEGLAAVQDRGASNGAWGFINTEFKAATPFCFDTVGDFRAGLAAVFIKSGEGNCRQYAEFVNSTGYGHLEVYIDKTGKVVKPQW